MSSVPAEKGCPFHPAETIERRFRELEAVWEAETAYLSSSREILEHRAFQEIVGQVDPWYR